MVEEGADKWGVEIVDVQLRGLHPVPRRREDQQQPQGVPVRSKCMRAGLALTYQAVCEERLQGRGKRGHRLPPRGALQPVTRQRQQLRSGREVPVCLARVDVAEIGR